MEKLLHFFRDQGFVSRVGFAAFMYLAVGVLFLSFLAGLVVTGAAQPPQAAPGQAEASVPEPDVTIQQQRVEPDDTAVAARPSPEASLTPEAVPTQAPIRRTFRPRPLPSPKLAPSPAPAPVVAQAQVGITDAGIYPKDVTIVPGGTVTWVNQGLLVHTATRLPGTDYKLDTGGLATGQSFSLTIFDPGTYHYTSAPDCLAEAAKDGFDCTGATITVVPPSHPSALPLKVAAQTPSAVTVNITDAGFVPDQVTIKAGGAIIWVNQGSAVHTATATSGGKLFDSGGLAPHQSAKTTFASPGTFTYTSAPECLRGNRSRTFGCARTFTVMVTV